ncbi:unnamed protein product [Adineta steineri]|uniref:F-box domain-containing protein n=1 Tax=Adineta steineri TaxID=433720 RepID=A0A815DMP9_9BILA|nr:unnamed protein product [Adineta steineri]
MNCICLFDLLPIELLHILFNYFWAHEILYTFSDVSDYMNAVLRTYSTYRLDLKSIEIFHFNLICRLIRAEQVIYLRFSDDNNTPGLSEQFLSRFQIEHFTQIRSLVLDAIEITSIESIFSNLHRLDQLHSLLYNSSMIRYVNRGERTDRSNEINRILRNVRESYMLIAPQLTHLHLRKSILTKTIQFPNLLRLKLEKCSMKDLRIIFLHAPLLKSLDVSIQNEEPTCDFILKSIQFTRLHMKVKNILLSMDIIEQFILKFPNLKYLTLEIHGQYDIVNAQRWEKLASNFITFNFKFFLLNSSYSNLNSFRTSFWLEEKHWFIASDSNSIFSVPYFAPLEMTLPGYLFLDCNIPDNHILYDKITKLIINDIPDNKSDYRFLHIKALDFKYLISLESLLSIINLNQIEHLSIPSIQDILIFNSFLSIMPKLFSLTILLPITAERMEEMQNYQFKQIHNLTIYLSYKNTKYIIESLFRLFPHTKRIVCMTHLKSLDNIIRIVHGFKDLTHASFYSNCLFSTRENTYCFDTKLNLREKRIFTSRIYSLTNYVSKYNINIWLKDEVVSPQKYWSLQRVYYWYRLKYILLSNFTFNIVLVQAVNFFLIEYKNIINSRINIELISNLFLMFSFCILLLIIFTKITRYFSSATKIWILNVIALYYIIYILKKSLIFIMTLLYKKKY